MAASTWRNRRGRQPVVARFRELLDRQPTANELALLPFAGLTLGAQARVRRAVARLISRG